MVNILCAFDCHKYSKWEFVVGTGRVVDHNVQERLCSRCNYRQRSELPHTPTYVLIPDDELFSKIYKEIVAKETTK